MTSRSDLHALPPGTRFRFAGGQGEDEDIVWMVLDPSQFYIVGRTYFSGGAGVIEDVDTDRPMQVFVVESLGESVAEFIADVFEEIAGEPAQVMTPRKIDDLVSEMKDSAAALKADPAAAELFEELIGVYSLVDETDVFIGEQIVEASVSFLEEKDPELARRVIEREGGALAAASTYTGAVLRLISGTAPPDCGADTSEEPS